MIKQLFYLLIFGYSFSITAMQDNWASSTDNSKIAKENGKRVQKDDVTFVCTKKTCNESSQIEITMLHEAENKNNVLLGKSIVKYYTSSKSAFILHLEIEESNQKKGYGTRLVYHTLATLYTEFELNAIKLVASPYKALQDPAAHTQLVAFHNHRGAITGFTSIFGDGTHMTYSVRFAAMLEKLLPVFEQLQERGNTRKVTTTTPDTLGIIAHYMGATNHIDEKLKDN